MFQGIERIRAAGNERDYISLEYAEGEKVFLPIEQVNLVQRYIGQEGDPEAGPPGGQGLAEPQGEGAKSAVEDMAGRWLALYSRAQAPPRASPSRPTPTGRASSRPRFPYQETEDQLTGIEAVKLDMESPRPMDRLVCGDVGYGKTEIALRAAFKAVMGGRQVAMLAPTTILVEQHFETFKERFARFPVRIEMLSRFRSRASRRSVARRRGGGAVDIVIGTHRLIQKDVALPATWACSSWTRSSASG